MNLAAYERYSAELEARLRADPRVLGLVALGSYADAALRDGWSDHDFWVVAADAEQDALLGDLAWLPDAQAIAVAIRAAPNYYTLLYHTGHQVEFGVFDLAHLGQAKTNRFRVVFGSDEVRAQVAALAQATRAAQQAEPELDKIFAYLLVALCVGVARYRRGELLSAHQYIFGYALSDLLSLAVVLLPAEQGAERLDGFDPRRRFEQAYPSLAGSVAPLLEQNTPQAALAIHALAAQLYGERMPEPLQQAAQSVLQFLHEGAKGY